MKLHDWSQIPLEQLNPQLTRQAIHTVNMTVACIRLAKGSSVPEHSHSNEQVSVVQSGKLKFIFPNAEFIVEGGQVMEIASNDPHRVEALEDSVVLDLFAPRREDWISGDDAYLRR